ncbi:hypothetical protein BKA62DRAFT_689447 [Auriculariales sp. MPI-PUGE-AT-0066]|nr:hypothetical protein BKA62DRAFT_689447 [Auriculariales sp. MPI-PUGE-AT-0066]
MSNNTITSDYRPPDPGRSASRQTTPHQPESFPPHGTNKDGAAASNSGSLKDNISNVPVSQHSQKPTIDTTNLDLLTRIEGMYRFLDVVSEQGTGGVVDKIVIDEAGVKAFVNKLHPGAYKTISSVDFTSLDASRLELVGVYGSKTEITRFLVESGHVDESIAALLNKPLSSQASLQSQPCLRSGLYILDADLGQVESRRTYVIFWPEDSTWKNNAASSTKRNRIAFMRYLTKLADQLLVFVSPEDAKSIIWQESTTTLDEWSIDEGDQDDGDDNIFSSDRIFDFSVEKTAEQDEDVRTRPGFQVPHQSISLPMEVDEETSSALLRPRLVPGELAQAILTAVPQAASTVTQSFKEPYNEIALRRFILDARVVRIGPDVTEMTVWKSLLGTVSPTRPQMPVAHGTKHPPLLTPPSMTTATRQRLIFRSGWRPNFSNFAISSTRSSSITLCRFTLLHFQHG